MSYSPLPKEELELFKQLRDLRVIFDVGARDDVEYLEIWPNSEYHLFEPNPSFFLILGAECGDKSNVFLNNYGLGDKDEERYYQDGRQSFVGSESIADGNSGDRILPIKTLDGYIKENDVKSIDFLKIDTEGFDFKVLVGGKNARKITRFIQYEHWDDKEEFHRLLEEDFDMEYIGLRNVLCMNKKLVSEEERSRLRAYIKDNNLATLV